MRKIIAFIGLAGMLIAVAMFIMKRNFPIDVPISFNQVDSIIIKNNSQVIPSDSNLVLKDSAAILEFVTLINEFSSEIDPPDPKINRGSMIIELYYGDTKVNDFTFVYFDNMNPVLYFPLGRAFTNPSLNEYFKGIF